MGGDLHKKKEMFMLRYIHYNSKFEKQLKALKKSEKMAVSAAKKAEEIITNVLNNDNAPLSILGKFTKHGESRIKNCIKFDIGKGYRLVCVKDKGHLFLLNVGTHDDCATWIENNRNLSPDPTNKNMISYEVSTNSNESYEIISDDLLEADYEEILLDKITDKDLQYVFKGLIS